jgi:type I restriction enzyme S subunit
LSEQRLIDYTEAVSNGAKMPRVNWQDIARFETVIPPEPILEAFDEAVRPMIERIRINIMESRALAEIRDTLLPRLLSGEIRVKDAERVVEAAT